MELTNPVYKSTNVDAITASQQMYDVGASKKLHIGSWGGTIHNLSTVSMGHVRLRDGGASGTIIASWTLPTAVAGTIAPMVRINANMPIRKQFSSDVYIELVSGTITISFQFTGFECDA